MVQLKQGGLAEISFQFSAIKRSMVHLRWGIQKAVFIEAFLDLLGIKISLVHLEQCEVRGVLSFRGDPFAPSALRIKRSMVQLKREVVVRPRGAIKTSMAQPKLVDDLRSHLREAL